MRAPPRGAKARLGSGASYDALWPAAAEVPPPWDAVRGALFGLVRDAPLLHCAGPPGGGGDHGGDGEVGGEGGRCGGGGAVGGTGGDSGGASAQQQRNERRRGGCKKKYRMAA